jgi:penicillin-binding protein 2
VSYHPNEVSRRATVARGMLALGFLALTFAFFRAQVLRNKEFLAQAEQNRFREVPLAAPRGIIYDRNGLVIAENLPGYAVSLLSPTADSLRSAMRRLSNIIPVTDDQVEAAVRRWRKNPTRPAVILPDAPFDVVAVLEERRVENPSLIIQSTPKRYYPDGPAVASFVGYTGEITEKELADSSHSEYKPGQQIGKGGLERSYEAQLRGREGVRYVEVDARGRVVRDAGARAEEQPVAAAALRTNIDMDLQKFVVSLLADSLRAGVVALDPTTGAVLALHSGPTFDPNRFVGGIPADYWRELNTDERRPLYNKVIQGRYPPASTWKLATSAMAMEAGLVTLDDHMPVPCTGGYRYGRYFRCWNKKGHGDINLRQAIEQSCDVYFYQVGLKLGLSRMVAGGLKLKMRERSGVDLPNETQPQFPPDAQNYFNERYGARGWVPGSVALNLSIGQGENAQTLINMARFYTALATDGHAARPEIVSRNPDRVQIMNLTEAQMLGLRQAMAGVVSSRGTANSARVEGITVAGKTGTAQNPPNPDHAWFMGFAPVDQPKIVVGVFVEYGEHGYVAARIATKVMAHYLKAATAPVITTE